MLKRILALALGALCFQGAAHAADAAAQAAGQGKGMTVASALTGSAWRCRAMTWRFGAKGALTLDTAGDPAAGSPLERMSTRITGSYAVEGSDLISRFERQVLTHATPEDRRVAIGAGVADFRFESVSRYKIELQGGRMNMQQLSRVFNGKQRKANPRREECSRV